MRVTERLFFIVDTYVKSN